MWRKFKNIKDQILLLFIRNKFYRFGKSRISYPFKTKNQHMISVGSGTIILEYGWIQGQVACNVNYKEGLPSVIIGDNCYIGHFSHIIGSKSIIIEDNVLIADKVCIADSTHTWRDIDKPVKEQPILFVDEVKIRQGAWIGEGVTILPGVTIGLNSVIGANSVVNKSIPDYSMAVGNPAKVVKKYNYKSKKWEKVNK
jgi:acetyltransferase-like isoleucine patch superfamily enzyme